MRTLDPECFPAYTTQDDPEFGWNDLGFNVYLRFSRRNPAPHVASRISDFAPVGELQALVAALSGGLFDIF